MISLKKNIFIFFAFIFMHLDGGQAVFETVKTAIGILQNPQVCKTAFQASVIGIIKACEYIQNKKVSNSQENAVEPLSKDIKLVVDNRDYYLVPEDLLYLSAWNPEEVRAKLERIQEFKEKYKLKADIKFSDPTLMPSPEPEDPKKPDDKDKIKKITLNPNSPANQIVRSVSVEPGGILKEFHWTQKMVEHIFSKSHIEDGILRLGKNQEEILKSIEEIILKVNRSSNSLGQVDSTIRSLINEYKITIRVRLDIDGSILNIDAFCGYESRILGKLIEI